MSEQATAQLGNAALLPASAGGILQRKCACGNHTIAGGECDDCKKGVTAGNTLRRAAAGPGFVDGAPPIVHEVLRSPGQPLDAATRNFFEPRFGHEISRVRTNASGISQSALTVGPANDPLEQEADESAANALRVPSASRSSLSAQPARADFSRVRIHTDAPAADSSRALNARAYTVGNHIVFGAGHYAPATTAGKHLLAHELAHTLQQGSSPAVVQRACDPTQAPLDTRTKPVFFPNQRSILQVFEGKATLAPGTTRFAAVGLVQQALVDLKFNLGNKGPNKDGVTRKYSAETKKAVGDFQISEAVKDSKPGVVDQSTIKCLDEQRSRVAVSPSQVAANVTAEDVKISDEESAGRDEDIYFERGKAELDVDDRLKLGFLINSPVKPLKGCPLTLEGFVSEDELVEFGAGLATDRIKAVDAELVKWKHDDPGTVCTAPVQPLRRHSPLPDKSSGVSAYRKRRKVEIVPAGEKSTTAPCPPDAEQFRKLSDPEKTILTTAIDLGVGWMKTAIEKLTPKNAEGDAALTAYFGGTKRRSRIRSNLQTWRKHLNSITRKKNQHGTDCNAVCREATAFNTFTGASAQMTLCPKFFNEIPHHPILSQDEKKALVIMHEAGHGSIDTKDTGYGHRRLIEFLSQYPELAENNTDSYTLMVLCLSGFNSFCNAPKAADSPTGMSDAEKTDSRRGLGWLQTWLIWTEQDTSSMYGGVNTAREKGQGIRTRENYYADVFDLLMATFNVHRPPEDAPPTAQEQMMVAAVYDRILKMKEASYAGLEVEKDTDVPPYSYWALGPGRKVYLEPDYFLLTNDRDRLEHLLPLIIKASTGISVALEPVYEKFIKANVKKGRGDVPKK